MTKHDLTNSDGKAMAQQKGGPPPLLIISSPTITFRELLSLVRVGVWTATSRFGRQKWWIYPVLANGFLASHTVIFANARDVPRFLLISMGFSLDFVMYGVA